MSCGHGAARRRRDRQLPAWHRHVKMTVAMELATALHHHAQNAGPVVEEPREGEVYEGYDVLREQKPPLPGMRSERLSEALGPQGGLERAVCPCSRFPLLTPVVMVQEAAHDDATIAF